MFNLRVMCSIVDDTELLKTDEGEPIGVKLISTNVVQLDVEGCTLRYEDCSVALYDWALSLMDSASRVDISHIPTNRGWLTVGYIVPTAENQC